MTLYAFAFACTARSALRSPEELPLPLSGWTLDGVPPDEGLVFDTARGSVAVSGPVPRDWITFGELSMHVDRAPGRPLVLEVHAVEAEDARFLRKVEIAAVGESELRLPLRWFRWGEGRVPDWASIDHVELHFRSSGILEVDEVSLLPGRAYKDVNDLAELARSVSSETPRIERRDEVVIVTTAPELDELSLVEHLDAVDAALIDALPFLPEPRHAIPLVVLEDPSTWAEYLRVFAEAHGGVVDPPGHDGFTLLGVGTSAWSSDHGTLRPAYAHEIVHASISLRTRLPSSNEWFQEGLANWIQLRFHPQEDFDAVVRQGMADPNWHLPLERLCDGTDVPRNRTWQALTVVEMLVESPEMPALFEAFEQTGSTALGPHLGPILGTDWEGLDEAWRAHVAASYGIE